MTRFTIALVAATLAAGPTLASEPVDAMAAFVRAQTQAWVATPAVIEALRAQNVETASLSQADIDAMDHDSEDSNRESHEANDYPDEPEFCSDDSEDDYRQYGSRSKHKKKKHQYDSDQDAI